MLPWLVELGLRNVTKVANSFSSLPTVWRNSKKSFSFQLVCPENILTLWSPGVSVPLPICVNKEFITKLILAIHIYAYMCRRHMLVVIIPGKNTHLSGKTSAHSLSSPQVSFELDNRDIKVRFCCPFLVCCLLP